jgi:hypothetical protein
MTMHTTDLNTPDHPRAASPVAAIRRKRFITREVVLWSTAAIFATGYLTVLGLAPEWLEDLTPSVILDPQSSQGQRAAARLAADVKALHDSVSQVQLELAKVKTEVAGNAENQKLITARLSALTGDAGQTASQGTTDAATPAAPVPEAPPAQVQIQASAEPASQTSTTAPANTTVQPKLINADGKAAVLSLETGSVEAPNPATASANVTAIDFGPAVVKPAPKPVGVKISSGNSVDSLRLSWSLLADRHADTLKNLEPRYKMSGDPANPNYDLVAGPIKSRAEANKVCKALAAQNVPCKVGEFAGDTL